MTCDKPGRASYNHLNCRCVGCRKAESKYQKKYRRKMKKLEPKRHGTSMGYVVHGCRCDECKAWGSKYKKDYNERNK